MEVKNENREIDWELSEEYYAADETKRELKLEDFMEDEELHQENDTAVQGTEVERTAEDVRKVMELTSLGKTAVEIAQQLEIDAEYVNNIQICVQSFPEDNAVAVAHLILMG